MCWCWFSNYSIINTIIYSFSINNIVANTVFIFINTSHCSAKKKMALYKNKVAKRIFYVCIALVGVVILMTCFITPLAFRFCPSIIRSFIFQPHDEIPENVDYKNPENSGFVGGRNFYLTTEDGAKLGVWHTLPLKLEVEARNLSIMDEHSATEIYNDWLSEGTVFLYLHGSAGTRTSSHRLRVYRLLNSLNYHVIAFDYRGYGDSTSLPMSESDVIKDTLTVIYWLQERVVSGNIFIWGHSLGTGVAAHTSEIIENKYDLITGIILEAPFNNIAEAVQSHPITKVVSFLPWFNFCFIQPLYNYDLAFESDKHLKNISTPLLILHARDDDIVPYSLAAKLYEDVAVSRSDPSTVRMISYDSVLGYGHYNIALDPILPNTIRNFVEHTIP